MSDRHLSSWPPSAPRDLDPPQTSLWVNAENAAKANPDRRCLVFYDSALSYAEFHRDCERMAGYLTEACGVKKGDRVAIYMQNSPQFVLAYYAILRANAVVVPINPMNLTKEIRYMLEDSGAKVMFASQELAPQVLPLTGGDPLAHLIVATYSDYLRTQTELTIPDCLFSRVNEVFHTL